MSAMIENNSQRFVTLYTPQKTYTGFVDISSEKMRTIDLLNSLNVYWKDPTEKSFNDSIMLKKVNITIEGGTPIGRFQQLQMRLSDIIFFTDNEGRSGHFTEKIRASTLRLKNGEKTASVRILTRMSGDAFYIITGKLEGLFKSKSKHRYLPLTQATVNAVTRTGDNWTQEKLVSDTFIGLSIDHIEACSFH